MFAASRQLIAARQKWAKLKIERKEVRIIGSGQLGRCFNEAYENIDRKKGIVMVSGWIVEPYNADTNCTEIISHFWNADRDGNMFDTAPLPNKRCEHIIDMDLLEFGQKHFNSLRSLVPSSLLLRNNNFEIVERDEAEAISVRPIGHVTTESLFTANKI